MSPKLTAQLARLDRMSLRERVVVTLCVCTVVWFIATAFVINPAEREIATYGQLGATEQEALNAANRELEGLRNGSVPPPGSGGRRLALRDSFIERAEGTGSNRCSGRTRPTDSSPCPPGPSTAWSPTPTMANRSPEPPWRPRRVVVRSSPPKTARTR